VLALAAVYAGILWALDRRGLTDAVAVIPRSEAPATPQAEAT
jgi:hypothetical protein